VPRYRRFLPLILSLALVPVACGGDDSGDGDRSVEASTEAEQDKRATVPGGGDPEAVKVIDEWSDALRGGDVNKAASYFKLPSIAQNGTPPINLETRADVIEFNKALPCGAELTRAEPQGEFVVATFELTERPGPGECGPGVGETARTAFVIEDGKIAEWVRAVDEPGGAEPEATGPIV
jgi:hypothetical protein